MFFSLKSDCYFRKYGDIGYIVRPIVSIEEVVNGIGALFLEKLDYIPKSIDNIISVLREDISEVSEDTLKHDVAEFYMALVEDGFLNYGETALECPESGFCYSTLSGKISNSVFRPQIEEDSSHFLGNYFKYEPFLETFHIELTSKCNERCVHCYIPHETKNNDIDYDLMMKVLMECKKMNVLTLIFSGGEPTLHPHFCDFLIKAKDLDFNVTVLSNMINLTAGVLSALSYRHATCVNVSLYSLVPSVHDSITKVNGSCERTKNNILRLVSENIPVQINCPVMKQNMETFQDVLKWGQALKCAVNVDYLLMARSDRSTDNLGNRLDEKDLRAVIGKIVNSNVEISNHSFEKQEISCESSLDDKICGVGMSTLCMVSNGDIYPCAGWQRYVCGNIKQQELSEIWMSSTQVKYLRSLRLKDFEKCAKCKDINYCVMCMSRNSNEDANGSIFNIPDITCAAARIHHEIIDEYERKQS